MNDSIVEPNGLSSFYFYQFKVSSLSFSKAHSLMGGSMYRILLATALISTHHCLQIREWLSDIGLPQVLTFFSLCLTSHPLY